MKGINIKNFYETLEHYTELEFEYQNIKYVIEPIFKDDKRYLTIWRSISDTEATCMIKEMISLKQGIEKEVIDKVLNSKCFNGKSFFEIYNDIEILAWF